MSGIDNPLEGNYSLCRALLGDAASRSCLIDSSTAEDGVRDDVTRSGVLHPAKLANALQREPWPPSASGPVSALPVTTKTAERQRGPSR